MINSFSKFLVEEEKVAYITMDHFNPPTIGDGMMLDTIAESAKKNTYKIFVSQVNEKTKNPLLYKEKVKYMRKMFPKHARSVVMDSTIKSPVDAAVKLFNEGYKKIVVIAEENRSREYEVLLEKYNGKKSRHGFYHFESMKFVPMKQHGANSQKQCEYALNEDFTSFAQNLPKEVTNKDAKDLFNAVRKGMGLKERKEFKNHIQLEPVSALREAYVNDGLFEKGDQVYIHKNEVVGNIKHLGANYVIVESKGETWRCWLNDVSKVETNNKNYDTHDFPNDDFDGIIRESLNEAKTPYEWGTPEATKKAKKMTPGEAVSPAQQAAIAIAKKEKGIKETPQDPDIKDREGTQPKRYHAGLERATKVARDRHFKKHGKKADNDPSAYKPAPGDATAKTKPSKYTTAVKKMMGEEGEVAAAKDRINKEKELDRKHDDLMKQRHDKILDRARRSRMLRRNKGIKDA